MTNLNKFIRKNWIAIIGVLIGLLGFSSSIYFYQVSKKEREPFFIVEPTRINIIDYDRLSDTQLRIIRKDGSKIEGNVSVVQFYFWNNGKMPIKKSNILEPIVIALQDDNSEIIDYRILNISRNVVDPEINRDISNPKRILTLSFNIMEKNDGISCQIIYKGEKNVRLQLSGTIEGVKKIRAGISFSSKLPRIILAFVGLLLIFYLIFFAQDKIQDKIFALKIKKGAKIVISSFFVVLYMFILFGVIVPSLSEMFKTDIHKVIPKAIIPM